MEELVQKDWVAQYKSEEATGAEMIDVRTPQEWAEGVIEGAEKIDFFTGDAFVEALDKLDRDKAYFMICRSGNRSGQACQMMDQMGFKKTYNLLGGMLDWEGELKV